MKKNDFRDRVDSRLSSLSWDEAMSQKVLGMIDQKEEKNVRIMSKWTMALLFALILVGLTTAVGFATGNFFGILQYIPEKADNQAYLDTVLSLGQTYACDAFTLSLNEVAFDGIWLTASMEIHPNDGAEPVFVLPGVRATVDGKPAGTFWEGGMGFDEDGFWAPDISRMVAYPEYGGVEIALRGRAEETGAFEYRATDQAVSWELTFDVYRPAMPLEFTEEDEPGIGDEPWTEDRYQAHEQAFADAYRDGKILLDQYADPWWYLGCIPQKDGKDGGEKDRQGLWENALEMGVFKLADQAVFRFETKPISVHTVENRPLCTLPDGLAVTLEKMDVSVDQVHMRLRIAREDGTPAAESNDAWQWNFVLLAENAETTWTGGCFGLQEDGSMLYESQASLSRPTESIRIVPCREPENWIWTGGDNAREVVRRQAPFTDEQKELTVTVELK